MISLGTFGHRLDAGLRRAKATMRLSGPSLGFVFPGKKKSKYAVHSREGWLHAARHLGLRSTGYYSEKRNWNPDEAVKFLNGRGHDLVFLVGGDCHQPLLHLPEGASEAWSKLRCPSVCICDERVLFPGVPESEQKTRSALQSYSFFAFTDETAQPFFTASGKPNLWIPQYIDGVTIRTTELPLTRQPLTYFRGQITNWGIEGLYVARRRLYQELQGQPNVILEEAYTPHLTPSGLLQRKASFDIYLHLPSNHPGYVTSFMEAGALGLNVLQHEIEDNMPRTEQLFEAHKHFIPYRTTDVEGLKRIIQESVREINSPEMKTMAKSLQELVMREHTLARRLETILATLGVGK